MEKYIYIMLAKQVYPIAVGNVSFFLAPPSFLCYDVFTLVVVAEIEFLRNCIFSGRDCFLLKLGVYQ